MSDAPHDSTPPTALLSFDGSDDAAAAIAKAGELLGRRPAVVLSVWEPVRTWEPWDPATIVSAPLDRLLSNELDLDQIVAELARDKADQGAALAQAAGFEATARVAGGKTWEAICRAADELNAEAIVIGSRGLRRARHAKRAVLVGPTHLVDGAGSTRSQ